MQFAPGRLGRRAPPHRHHCSRHFRTCVSNYTVLLPARRAGHLPACDHQRPDQWRLSAAGTEPRRVVAERRRNNIIAPNPTQPDVADVGSHPLPLRRFDVLGIRTAPQGTAGQLTAVGTPRPARDHQINGISRRGRDPRREDEHAGRGDRTPESADHTRGGTGAPPGVDSGVLTQVAGGKTRALHPCGCRALPISAPRQLVIAGRGLLPPCG